MARAKIALSEIDSARFWSKVAVSQPDKCWLWLAYRDQDGYGYFTINKRARKAHRVAYLLAHGTLDQTRDVCHTCDNPSCVNPLHLWQGTPRENIEDMLSKGRSLRGKKNPKAKLTPIKVFHILELWSAGLLQKEIAVKLNCNQRTVSAIITGKQWSHLTGIRYAKKR